MNKSTLTAGERLAQQQFSQSVPIIERERKSQKPTTTQNNRT